MEFRHKDLLSLKQLSKDEILYILELSKYMKEINDRKIKKVPTLKGKTVVNAFFEPSTRTRTSFEIAAKRLSADTINFTSTISSTTKGETLLDTIRNIERMKTDFFVIRHKYSGAPEFIANNINSHVINAGDGINEHPTQALLDLFTIKESKKSFDGLNVSIIGDITHSRVARSNIWAMQKLGCNITLFGPQTVIPPFMEDFNCKIASSIKDALLDAEVIIMLRIQLERQSKILIPSLREYSLFFGLNEFNKEFLKREVIVMHPGPINRGVELSSSIADGKHSTILNQVENGIAVRMAILYLLNLGKAK
ncbi:MAG: aspartate carbamoyltransferase catalytic subunit [Deferribacterota bacterium]|nr:aspartate carbamoyltransferase catalytic subunit [Deferribacterota bacterium]